MYLVWTINNHYNLFKKQKSAKQYCNKLKVEAYINCLYNTPSEDTIYGNGKYWYLFVLVELIWYT